MWFHVEMAAVTALQLLPRLVDALVRPRPAGKAPAYLLQLDARSAAVSVHESGSEQLTVFLCYGANETPAAELHERLAQALQSERPEVLAATEGPLAVVVLGGAGKLASWSALPSSYEPLGRRLVMYHVPDVADPEFLKIHGPTDGETLLPVLGSTLRSVADHDIPFGQLAPATTARLKDLERQGEAVLGEAGAFNLRAQGTLPILVTAGVGAALLAMLILQWCYGGVDSTQTLMRMGANRGLQTLHGQWWRLLSAATLHGGLVHLLRNLFCLLMLTPYGLAALGKSRFCILFVASTVGAEALSAWAHPEQLGYGSSGGLFGLMAGLFVLALRRHRAVPQLARGTLTYSVGFLLFINGCGSFRAGVGGTAHLGGALAGALLVGSGMLTLGLASPDEPAWPGWRWVYRLAALGALGLTGTAVALAFVTGRPWELRHPTLESALLTGTGVSVRVPVGLAQNPKHRPHPDEGYDQFIFGEALHDPLIISMIVRRLGAPIPKEALPAATTELLKLYSDPPPKEKGEIVWDAPPRIESLASGPAIFLNQHRGANRLPRWVMLRGEHRIDLQISVDPDAQASWEALAPLIAASVNAR